MKFEFVRKPKSEWNSGNTQAQSNAKLESKASASSGQRARATDVLSDAEIVAGRKRTWEQALEVSRRRRRLLADLRNGKISRESLSPAELEILESVQRLERRWVFETWASRLYGTGLSALVAALVSAASAFTGSCANQVLRYPQLLKFGAVVGGLGVITLAGALVLWVIQRWLS